MFKIIGIVVVLAIAGLLAFAATKPDAFRVERSASIKAPREKIFAQIDSLRGWRAWSPYEKLDPALKRTFSGPDSGVGSVYAWEGNSKAGQGRMEIIESSPSSKIVMKLDFVKPFKASDIATFTLEPEGDMTRVSWAMEGPSPYVVKLMGTVFNMDHMIGRDFETGLATLKAQTEAAPPPPAAGTDAQS